MGIFGDKAVIVWAAFGDDDNHDWGSHGDWNSTGYSPSSSNANTSGNRDVSRATSDYVRELLGLDDGGDGGDHNDNGALRERREAARSARDARHAKRDARRARKQERREDRREAIDERNSREQAERSSHNDEDQIGQHKLLREMDYVLLPGFGTVTLGTAKGKGLVRGVLEPPGATYGWRVMIKMNAGHIHKAFNSEDCIYLGHVWNDPGWGAIIPVIDP
jgi:hypothetical protein